MPVSSTSGLGLGLQKAAAGLVVALLVWAVIMGIGLVAFGYSAFTLAPADLACVLAVELVFVLIPLAIAFLLGQLGCGESVSNTVGNITGMVLTFLGGTWISLDLMPEAVRVVATFTPVYWLGEGLRAAVGDATGSAAEGVALAVDVLLLFAAAIFVTALVVGRMRATQRRRRRQCRGRCAEVAPWAPCRDRAARCAVGAVPRGTWDALSSRRPAFHLLRRGTCGTIRTRAFRRVICSVAWRSGSAGALQAQGRGFKSLIAHHLKYAPSLIGFYSERVFHFFKTRVLGSSTKQVLHLLKYR